MTSRYPLIAKVEGISNGTDDTYYAFLYGLLGGKLDPKSLKIIQDLGYNNDEFWKVLICNRIGSATREQIDAFESMIDEYYN